MTEFTQGIVKAVKSKIDEYSKLKELIVVVDLNRPAILEHIKASSSGVIATFGVLDQIIFEGIYGKFNPSGKLPFDGKSMVSILAAISRGKPTAIDTLVPDIPQDLADLIMQLLSSERAKRPANANEVVRRLRAIEKQ